MGGTSSTVRPRRRATIREKSGAARRGPPADDDRAAISDDRCVAADRHGKPDGSPARTRVVGARRLVCLASLIARAEDSNVVLCRPCEPRRPEAADVRRARRQRAVYRYTAIARGADTPAAFARAGD